MGSHPAQATSRIEDGWVHRAIAPPDHHPCLKRTGSSSRPDGALTVLVRTSSRRRHVLHRRDSAARGLGLLDPGRRRGSGRSCCHASARIGEGGPRVESYLRLRVTDLRLCRAANRSRAKVVTSTSDRPTTRTTPRRTRAPPTRGLPTSRRSTTRTTSSG